MVKKKPEQADFENKAVRSAPADQTVRESSGVRSAPVYPFSIPAQTLLGVSSAGGQIDGGDRHSNWYAWSLAGKVGKPGAGESSLTGAGHWDLWREDAQLAADLHIECTRMSIEWSRLEPAEGQWDEHAAEHYRSEIALLIENNIEPMITLHHFTCPQWFQDKGGWLCPQAVMYFTRFVSYAAEQFGSLVKVWCTINEPNVFANDTYMDGKYPPGHKGDIGAYFKTARTMIRAHAQSYDIIHRECARHRPRGETLVGFAHHIAVFEPYDSSFFSRLGCRLQNYLFHTLFYKGFVEGRLAFPLGIGQRVRPKKQRCKHTARAAERAVRARLCDYIGINYYSRHLFKGTGRVGDLFAVPVVDPSVPTEQLNDLGWEIYPEGLYQTARSAWETYRIPVMITENGICDESDAKRASFIAAHLRQIVRLTDDNIPVLRYYHWSFLDNMEWNDGYGPRFGLTAVDYTTMKRTVRNSGRYYAHICNTHTVTNPQEKYL